MRNLHKYNQENHKLVALQLQKSQEIYLKVY